MFVLYRSDSGGYDSGSWAGGLVVKHLICSRDDAPDANSYLLAYDTGNMQTMTAEALKVEYEQGLLKEPAANAGGLACGIRVDDCVLAVAWHKIGKSDAKPVGVFVGNTGLHLFEADDSIPLCTSFFVHVPAWVNEGTARAGKRSCTTKQAKHGDRGDYHTYRRGDVVMYQVILFFKGFFVLL